MLSYRSAATESFRAGAFLCSCDVLSFLNERPPLLSYFFALFCCETRRRVLGGLSEAIEAVADGCRVGLAPITAFTLASFC